MIKVTLSTISFKISGKLYKFEIIHKMPQQRGLTIEDAVNNWLYRTTEFTADSLCEYINTKTGFKVAMTRAEHDKIYSL